MKVKAIIQTHYPERKNNLNYMIESLLECGIDLEDIILLVDYSGYEFNAPCQIITSNAHMPINWWHSVAALLDCDYVALLCDDLILRKGSIETLIQSATEHPDIGVWGFEGGDFALSEFPYSESMSNTSNIVKEADYAIRFYFAKPEAFVNALSLYKRLSPQNRIHDDLILSLSNKCGIAPTSELSGWIDLPEYEVAYSKDSWHYAERDALVNEARSIR